MNERFEISILLDLYKELLTDKQKNIMIMYYEEDFSLAEIAEINNTSRQAIHDLIKRCCKQLMFYEEKLKLMEKLSVIEESKGKVIRELHEIIELDKDNVEKKILEIENLIVNGF